MAYRYPSIVPTESGCSSAVKTCVPNKKATLIKTVNLDFTNSPFSGGSNDYTPLGLAYTVQTGVGPLFNTPEGILILPQSLSNIPSVVPKISNRANILGASFVAPLTIPNVGGPTPLNFTDSSLQFGALAIGDPLVNTPGEAVIGFWTPTGSPLWEIYKYSILGEGLPTNPIGNFEVYYYV